MSADDSPLHSPSGSPIVSPSHNSTDVSLIHRSEKKEKEKEQDVPITRTGNKREADLVVPKRWARWMVVKPRHWTQVYSQPIYLYLLFLFCCPHHHLVVAFDLGMCIYVHVSLCWVLVILLARGTETTSTWE